MQLRKLSNDTHCPRCGEVAETMNHIFRECPITKAVWEDLSFAELLKITHLEFKEWLTWVFEQISSLQCKTFYCALWAIWEDRNKRIHEKTSRSSSLQVAKRWEHPPSQFVRLTLMQHMMVLLVNRQWGS